MNGLEGRRMNVVISKYYSSRILDDSNKEEKKMVERLKKAGLIDYSINEKGEVFAYATQAGRDLHDSPPLTSF